MGNINIPVYSYVIYNNSNENISEAQVNSQISVLNADFSESKNDACMFMFSEGQKTRMRAIFASGGARDGFM